MRGLSSAQPPNVQGFVSIAEERNLYRFPERIEVLQQPRSPVSILAGCDRSGEYADKTVFVTTKKAFRFEILSFGLTHVPALFQRLMALVIGLTWEVFLVYLDDVIVMADVRVTSRET